MKRIALFPGSFDPFTNGHKDIVVRAVALFDEVIIGIGKNANKKRYFPLEFMEESINSSFENFDNIRVISYEGLTADAAKREGANFLLRGLRNTTDYEYENTIAQANRSIFEGLETILLITSPQYAYISSTVVRDLHHNKADISRFVPYKL